MMKRTTLLLIILALSHLPIRSQHYITPGIGFSGAFYQSEGLDRFKTSYNSVYNPYLAKYMQGLGQVVGLRGEIGYRRIERFGIAVLVGMQNYVSNDLAQFQNGETRKFELKTKSLFLEGEIGYTHNNLFINGVCTFFFNRKLSLKSTYSNPITNEDITNKALNGTYKGDTSISVDLGIAAGIYRDPVILIAKATYPIFTAGGSSVLEDNKLEKIENHTNVFPDDYRAYLLSEPYSGIASNIDGLKISLTVAFAIPL